MKKKETEKEEDIMKWKRRQEYEKIEKGNDEDRKRNVLILWSKNKKEMLLKWKKG